MAPALFALATAELAARLVTPPKTTIRPLPVDAEAYFTAEQIERGKRFVRPQVALGLARSVVELGALAAIARSRRRRLARNPLLDGALRAASITGVLTVAQLPLGALSRRRAMAAGLVTQPWRGWAVDVAKSTAIETTLAAAGGGAVVALTRRYPERWWIPAAAGAFGIGTLFGALAPVVLAPLFNDFTPLPEGETRADVLELAAAAGVDVGEVFSMDASRRSTVTNAYVTGLGPTKRVVLYDTLLEQLLPRGGAGRGRTRARARPQPGHPARSRCTARSSPRRAAFGDPAAELGAVERARHRRGAARRWRSRRRSWSARSG